LAALPEVEPLATADPPLDDALFQALASALAYSQQPETTNPFCVKTR
jgi:hypothetical protein